MADRGKYRSYRGRYVDLDAIRLRHEQEIAMGNMGVNARGDKIGPGGRIIEKASVKARQHYTGTSISKTSISIKNDQQDTGLFADDKKAKPKAKKMIEVENEQGDIILQEVDDETKGTSGQSPS